MVEKTIFHFFNLVILNECVVQQRKLEKYTDPEAL